ncbi:MAG: DUF2269 family protein [Actinobacteria bacterium]|nr:DUF2269 family protein [Actinomycetota bacterium]
METIESAEAAADRRDASGIVTLVVGLAVVGVALLFAFKATDAHSAWFAVFKLVHVGTVVFWVGGGLLLTALGLRAERSKDAAEIATIARQAAFAGERIFAPGGMVVLAMGIAMVINHHIGFGTTWVDIGLAGYAMTFVTGVAVLSPLAKKVGALAAEKGAEHPDTQAAIRRILLIARVDVGVLLIVIADMLMKPFS